MRIRQETGESSQWGLDDKRPLQVAASVRRAGDVLRPCTP